VGAKGISSENALAINEVLRIGVHALEQKLLVILDTTLICSAQTKYKI
jgi:hypothetical protein